MLRTACVTPEVKEGKPGPPGRPDTWHDWLCDISVFQTASRWSCEVGSHTDEPTAASLHLPHTHNSWEPDAGQNLGPFKWKLLMLKTQKGQKFVRFTPRRTSRVSAGFNACGLEKSFNYKLIHNKAVFSCDPPFMSLQTKYQADKIRFSPSESSGNMWSPQMSLLSYTYLKEENWLISVFQSFCVKGEAKVTLWRRRTRQTQGETTKSSSPRKWLGVFETINWQGSPNFHKDDTFLLFAGSTTA